MPQTAPEVSANLVLTDSGGGYTVFTQRTPFDESFSKPAVECDLVFPANTSRENYNPENGLLLQPILTGLTLESEISTKETRSDENLPSSALRRGASLERDLVLTDQPKIDPSESGSSSSRNSKDAPTLIPPGAVSDTRKIYEERGGETGRVRWPVPKPPDTKSRATSDVASSSGSRVGDPLLQSPIYRIGAYSNTSKKENVQGSGVSSTIGGAHLSDFSLKGSNASLGLGSKSLAKTTAENQQAREYIEVKLVEGQDFSRSSSPLPPPPPPRDQTPPPVTPPSSPPPPPPSELRSPSPLPASPAPPRHPAPPPESPSPELRPPARTKLGGAPPSKKEGDTGIPTTPSRPRKALAIRPTTPEIQISPRQQHGTLPTENTRSPWNVGSGNSQSTRTNPTLAQDTTRTPATKPPDFLNHLYRTNHATDASQHNPWDFLGSPDAVKIYSAITCGLACGALAAVSVPSAPILASVAGITAGAVIGYAIAEKIAKDMEKPEAKATK